MSTSTLNNTVIAYQTSTVTNESVTTSTTKFPSEPTSRPTWSSSARTDSTTTTTSSGNPSTTATTKQNLISTPGINALPFAGTVTLTTLISEYTNIPKDYISTNCRTIYHKLNCVL